MLYAVGTYIDLRHLNNKAAVETEPETRKPAEYPVGTKFLFLNLKSSLEILNVKTLAT
jgi:hypothetical protein